MPLRAFKNRCVDIGLDALEQEVMKDDIFAASLMANHAFWQQKVLMQAGCDHFLQRLRL